MIPKNMANEQKMFQSSIDKIRDILRTVGVTDQECIMHTIAFITLRRMNKQICKALDIDEKYTFENFGKGLDDEELRNKFWLPKDESFFSILRKTMGYKSFSFNQQIGNLHFRRIFKVLEDIDSKSLENHCDIVGDIYEMHLKTGSKNARDLGQFFTNRLAIKFMIDLVKPKILEDGGVETIADPTMGTGGFLSMAIDYYNKLGKINWKKNKDRIYGFDLDNRVRDYASINLFLETGYKFPHLYTRDTLNNDICVDEKPISCDIILANEPMGIKGLKYTDFCDRIKELKMNGTKAEPAFLQLFMQALNEGGRCAVVVPDGMLFANSKQHSLTRKHLVENFELREIVKMNDKNFFMNTGVSASIIYFCKSGEKTDTVKFSEISLNSDMTRLQYKEVVSVDYSAIKGQNYILNPSVYSEPEKEEIKIEGIEYKTLGEICEFLPKSKRSAKFGSEKGEFIFYSSSNNIKYCDIADYKEESIIIGTGGKANVNYGKNFSCSNHTTVISSNIENILSKYIYYYLNNNLDILERNFTGTALKNLSIIAIKNTKIPIPSLQIQKDIVERLDELTKQNEILDNLIEGGKKKFKWYMDIQKEKYTEIKAIKEICDYKAGKFISRDCQQEGKYPFYNSKVQGFSGYTDKYCFDYPEYLIITKDGGAGKGKYGDQIGMGTVYIVKGKSGATSHQLALFPKKIQIKYFYYVMKYFKNKIMDLAQYTTGLGTIRVQSLLNINIPFPPEDIQKQIADYGDNIFNFISSCEKQKEDNEVLMKNILETFIQNKEQPEKESEIIFVDEEENELEN